MAALVPQLSSSSPPPTRAVLERIVADPATTLFVARDEERVVGMLTLAVFQIPTGVRAWIEDVVVDAAARGSGGGGGARRRRRSTTRPSWVHARWTSRRAPTARRPTACICAWASRPAETNVYRRTLEADR